MEERDEKARVKDRETHTEKESDRVRQDPLSHLLFPFFLSDVVGLLVFFLSVRVTISLVLWGGGPATKGRVSYKSSQMCNTRHRSNWTGGR
jgi:hypothetical protein